MLLVDDNPAVSRAVEIALRIAGHRLDWAADPTQAHSRLAARRYDAVLLDLNFAAGRSGGEEGLACLARIVADDPGARVVVVTAHSGVRVAVAAMRAGARDFVTKPWRNADLVAKVEAAARGPAGGGAPFPVPAAAGAEPPRLLGDSPAVERLRALIRRIGPTAAGVTVTGPAGAGRTLAALAIHAASHDAATPPGRVDLRDPAAWARIEDARGALVLRHPDRLDEVAQGRLLDRLAPAVRPIAVADSTAALVPALRRRIATVEVAVPPLRERGDDAVLLARHFAWAAGERHGRPARLTAAAEAAVRATIGAGDWPDQVRGLALAVERAVLLADDGLVDAAALAPPGFGPELEPAAALAPDAPGAGFDLTEAERAVIAAALREHRHNVTHAAAALGLSRGALYRRMARHGF